MAEGQHLFQVTAERIRLASEVAQSVVAALNEAQLPPDMLLLIAALLVGTHCKMNKLPEPFPRESVLQRLQSIGMMIGVVESALAEGRKMS
jgi:hypothetical protein